MQNSQLPTLAELHSDPQTAFRNDQLKTLLNQPPHQSWVKKHPMAKAKNDFGQTVPSEYMPIDKVEFLLDYIFQEWRIEVLSAAVMFQSIAVTVRVHYKNPVTGEWSYHDGVGAKSVQVNSGASAADLSAIKDAAVQMALPSAKSYAIKDACEHLGKLFGRDLNRQNIIEYSGAYGASTGQQPQQQQMWQTETPQAPYGQSDQLRKEMYHNNHTPTPQPQTFNFNAL